MRDQLHGEWKRTKQTLDTLEALTRAIRAEIADGRPIGMSTCQSLVAAASDTAIRLQGMTLLQRLIDEGRR